MLVKSFLAIPKENHLSTLASVISKLENCEVTSPSSSEAVLVVVMENKDQESEDLTLSRLKQTESLDHIVLVSSFNENN